MAGEKEELPEELINEIALRLPVKSIARFKSVSKPWNLSFSNSDFVESHVRRAPERIILRDHQADKLPHVVTLSAGGGVSSRAVQSPFIMDNQAYEPLNCCNGLVLIRFWKGNRDELAVINPVTSRAMEVPEYYQFYEVKTRLGHGLGYSSVDHDYKIVVLQGKNHQTSGYTTCVSVFSFRTRSLKQLPDCLYPWVPYRPGVYADGHLHWLAGDEVKPPMIVAFDLSTEKFKEMPPPTGFEFEFGLNEIPLSKLVELGGCLALLSHNASGYCIGKPIDVWIMEKLGSWRKFTIADYPPTKMDQMYSYYKVVCRLGEFEFFLVKSDGELVAYNCETRVWREVDIKGLYLGRVLSFRENLSSIDAI